MTVTFDPADVQPKDVVRSLVGDIAQRADGKNVSDELIALYLTNHGGNVYQAAADAAHALAAMWATDVQKAVGEISLSAQQRFDHFLALADRLRMDGLTLQNASPLVGGISRADKEQVRQDADRVQPAFTKRQFDLPSTTPATGDRTGVWWP